MVEVLGQEKVILDATCGTRMMWLDKNNLHALFLDQRSEVCPDVVGDCRDLFQFADESFRLVVIDLPHHIKPLPFEGKRKDRTNRFAKCYGLPLNPETWPLDIKMSIEEGLRVLKPYGVLLFKWTTIHIKVKDVIAVFPVKPLFQNALNGHSASKKAQTYWFCFMKFPTVNPLKMTGDSNYQ
jgi:SAM-dependent methyltransferase